MDRQVLHHTLSSRDASRQSTGHGPNLGIRWQVDGELICSCLGVNDNDGVEVIRADRGCKKACNAEPSFRKGVHDHQYALDEYLGPY